MISWNFQWLLPSGNHGDGQSPSSMIFQQNTSIGLRMCCILWKNGRLEL
jgi:hypothetical protein